ncbi:hypothetical protein ABZZ17_13040 [Streptomyces sp. NPDC006512]|uniref:hypothetical protein n=1 Tax=Streptomyces sp. NPDC006512 TaxID=3154307 RepID=UPI0033B9E4DC
MTTLTWAARCVAAVSGAVLAGTLLAPAAAAHQGPDPKAPAKQAAKKQPAKKQPAKKQPVKKQPTKKQPVKQAPKPAPARPAPVTEPGASELATGTKCTTSRDVSSTVVDFVASGLFETVFRSATDEQGHAFLNDSRNPGVWINLALVPGAPRCVYDTSVAVTEESPGHLFITLLASDGTLHQATCATNRNAPFTPSNLPTACAPGFTTLPDTPV